MLLQARGSMRLPDIKAQGIHAITLSHMVDEGEVIRAAHGVYALPVTPEVSEYSLAEIAARVPKAVICLHSALHYHGVTRELPCCGWIAIGSSDRKPDISGASLRVLRFSPYALTADVQRVTIDGAQARVFSVAKSVVDCFRYRRMLGLDVALEALREAIRTKKAKSGEIARIAKALRLWSVIQPHLEGDIG